MNISNNRTEYPISENTPRLSARDRVLILFATVTGNAERIAHRLAQQVERCGFASWVMDMAHCAPDILTQARNLLIVASTCGDGEPPDDARPFCEGLARGNGLDLRGVQFSVLALGNRTFDRFCQCGRELDAALARLGATRLYPRRDCDADYQAPAQRWMNGVTEALGRQAMVERAATAIAEQEKYQKVFTQEQPMTLRNSASS
jgi:sulfite reductase (NADPH) flavoprotein alpha-component